MLLNLFSFCAIVFRAHHRRAERVREHWDLKRKKIIFRRVRAHVSFFAVPEEYCGPVWTRHTDIGRINKTFHFKVLRTRQGAQHMKAKWNKQRFRTPKQRVRWLGEKKLKARRTTTTRTPNKFDIIIYLLMMKLCGCFCLFFFSLASQSFDGVNYVYTRPTWSHRSWISQHAADKIVCNSTLINFNFSLIIRYWTISDAEQKHDQWLFENINLSKIGDHLKSAKGISKNVVNIWQAFRFKIKTWIT